MRRSTTERRWRIGIAFAIVLTVALVAAIVGPNSSDDVESLPEPAATLEIQQAQVEAAPADEQAEKPDDPSPESGWRLDDRAALNALTVAAESDGGVRYDRDDYDHYLGRDENGCNLRDRILLSEAIRVLSVTDRCDAEGEWLSWLDGEYLSDEGDLEIDHLVALAEAHRSGAWRWTEKQRREFSNDEATLSAVSRSANRAKSDHDPATWRPPAESVWCRYAREWIAIKRKYDLAADRAEVGALSAMLDSCTGPPLDNSAQNSRTSAD